MKNRLMNAITNAFIIFGSVSATYAQGSDSDVYWHIDPGVKSCSMVIDPSLTQAQWKTFVKQVGAIATFKSLASAEPLGKMNFAVGIDASSTPIDQRNPAWINTFTHPDADCPLGDAIKIPALHARMGISENMDVGVYWTHAPDANYGMVGEEVKYRFMEESEKLPAAAIRGSVSMLTGVADYDLSTYSIDFIASKKIAMFAPYAGIRGSLVIGTETTSKVDLNKEGLFLAQGYAGVTYSVWMLSLAAEYDVAHVNTFALAVGFKF